MAAVDEKWFESILIIISYKKYLSKTKENRIDSSQANFYNEAIKGSTWKEDIL
ncbi:hypothetical protein [Eisenbergiella sp.]